MRPLQLNEFRTCDRYGKAFGVVERDQHVVRGSDDECLVPQASEFYRTVEIEQHPHTGRGDGEWRKRFAGHLHGAAEIGSVCVHLSGVKAKYVRQHLVGAGESCVE